LRENRWKKDHSKHLHIQLESIETWWFQNRIERKFHMNTKQIKWKMKRNFWPRIGNRESNHWRKDIQWSMGRGQSTSLLFQFILKCKSLKWNMDRNWMIMGDKFKANGGWEEFRMLWDDRRSEIPRKINPWQDEQDGWLVKDSRRGNL